MTTEPNRHLHVRFQTLGCKVNQVESNSLADLAEQSGVSVTTDEANAAIVVVNTCAVTAEAEAKTRKAIRRACRDERVQRVIVTGCAAAISGADIAQLDSKVSVVPSKEDVPAAILEELPSAPHSPASQEPSAGERSIVYSGRTRVMVKVNDGCENFCSYCIVPYARGPQRSEPTDAIVSLVDDLSERGVPEVVLTGINIGRYQDPLHPGGLPALVTRIADTALHRLRLSSIEPNDVTEELMTALSLRSLGCEHLHIPLQSGSNRVLADMSRHYTAETFRRVARLVRRYWPDAALTTDVIVGYPTESEDDFADTLALCEEIGFSRLHVFRYSPRPGTPAAELPTLDPDVVANRGDRLRQLGEQLAADYSARFIGQEVEAVVERVSDGQASLTSRHFQSYRVPAGDLCQRDIIRYRIPTV